MKVTTEKCGGAGRRSKRAWPRPRVGPTLCLWACPARKALGCRTLRLRGARTASAGGVRVGLLRAPLRFGPSDLGGASPRLALRIPHAVRDKRPVKRPARVSDQVIIVVANNDMTREVRHSSILPDLQPRVERFKSFLYNAENRREFEVSQFRARVKLPRAAA